MSDLIFDKYEIQNRLAVGGMGEVFYAVQRQKGVKGFERPVILKSLLPDLAQQEGFIDQFLDEARVAATLNHPNVVSIYEVGLWDGVYFIAMEYIRGRNIAQLIKLSLKKGLPIPPSVTARIIHDAALGLDHAHHAVDGQGNPLHIVHRDISPQNIMVREDGVTKVVDFGIARATNRSTRTATGAVKGKLAYMSPEQLLSKPLDGLTDQFALGVVLWEMCCQRRLFTSERDLDIIKKVLEEPIPHPSKVVSGFPEDLGDVAMRMLARDQASRFPSCADVAKDLQEFLLRHSPPSADSPVAAYMKTLGNEDISAALRATPSNQNFVISLKKKGGEAAADGEAVEVSLDPTRTTPQTPHALSTQTGSRARAASRRRTAMAVVGVLALAAAAGVTSFALQRRQDVEPPPPVVVASPPEPVPAPDPAPAPAPPPPPPASAPAPGKLRLQTVPPGAAVRLDGRPVGSTPLTVEGAAGAHFVQVERAGFRRLEQEVTVVAGEETAVELKLEKLAGRAPATASPSRPAPPAAAQTGSGYLTLDTQPWTKVSVNDVPLGSTPLFKRPLPAGRHVLLLVNEGANIRLTRTVDIKPGEVTKLSFALP